MLWDGLEFFGFDDTKIPRLMAGSKTSYLDKFKNKKWLASTILGVVIVSFVLNTSLEKLGTVKSQKIELND